MSLSVVNLNYRELGDPQAPPLILLHGLFGSSINWMGITRQLGSAYRLILPDLRNHGRSPHDDRMNYPLMVDDLLALMDRLGISSASIVGHSMGGKLAMLLALEHPQRVDKLVVADIAPVTYPDRFQSLFEALLSIDLLHLSSRDEADRMLAQWITEPAVRNYLLQNLSKSAGGWQWRLNLTGLYNAMPTLRSFPESSGQQFPGEVLFIYGSASQYVKPEYQKVIESLFPHARLRMLAGAGHWVYAEQPEVFSRLLRQFI